MLPKALCLYCAYEAFWTIVRLQITLDSIGRGDWIRTSDPLRPRQVRYQAALRPDIGNPLILLHSPTAPLIALP